MKINYFISYIVAFNILILNCYPVIAHRKTLRKSYEMMKYDSVAFYRCKRDITKSGYVDFFGHKKIHP